MQRMKQMLRDFCQNYAHINNPQSEVETRTYEFLTDARNAFNRCGAEMLQSPDPSPGAQPASDSLSSPSSLPSLPSLNISALLSTETKRERYLQRGMRANSKPREELG